MDTAAWIALLNPDDDWHPQALQAFHELRAKNSILITSEFVLLELADALSSAGWRETTISFIEELRSLKNLEIIPCSPEWFTEGWKLYSKRKNTNWSLTDCISFEVRSALELLYVFTSDKHFAQAGFVKLLN